MDFLRHYQKMMREKVSGQENTAVAGQNAE